MTKTCVLCDGWAIPDSQLCLGHSQQMLRGAQAGGASTRCDDLVMMTAEAPAMVNALERSVELCRIAREKERASVVRYLRAKANRQDDGTTRTILMFAARDVEAGEHVRDELGGDDDRG